MATKAQVQQAINTLLGHDGTTLEECREIIRELSHNYSTNFISRGREATGDSNDVSFHLLLLKSIEETIENAKEEE